jgi:hypothetical protein
MNEDERWEVGEIFRALDSSNILRDGDYQKCFKHFDLLTSIGGEDWQEIVGIFPLPVHERSALQDVVCWKDRKLRNNFIQQSIFFVAKSAKEKSFKNRGTRYEYVGEYLLAHVCQGVPGETSLHQLRFQGGGGGRVKDGFIYRQLDVKKGRNESKEHWQKRKAEIQALGIEARLVGRVIPAALTPASVCGSFANCVPAPTPALAPATAPTQNQSQREMLRAVSAIDADGRSSPKRKYQVDIGEVIDKASRPHQLLL